MASTDRRLGVSGSAAFKLPCVAATTANITLEGLQTIDGITLVADDRVLVKNQSDATENGIYVADTSGWERAVDFNGPRDAVKGTLVLVAGGTVNGSTVFQLTTASPVIGTTSLTFAVTGTPALAYASAFIQTLLDDATAADARTTLGAVGLTGDESIAGAKTFTGAVVMTAGSLAVPTATAGDNDTSAASTAFVQTALGNTLSVADADANPTAATRVIRYSSLISPREINLPAASAVQAGLPIDIVDASGSASSTVTLSLDPDGSDTIAGSNATQVAINMPRGRCRIVSNGVNGWDVLTWSVELTGTLGGDVNLSNIANYFSGPTVNVGTVGVWEVRAKASAHDTGGGGNFYGKLWDGTTTIDSAAASTAAANEVAFITAFGRITNPAAALVLAVRDPDAVTGKILFNQSGNSKDSTIVARRVG